MRRGRPRKMSVSSVETIDDNNLVYNPEKKIVQPLQINERLDTDNWPCFILRDAIVYYRNAKGEAETHWMANLLHANYDGPFVVRGSLDVGDNGHRLQPRMANHEHVTIHPVSQFCLQVAPDNGGVVTLWAGGECGWYELHPSQSYLPIYRQMNEAIIMYFALEKRILENPSEATDLPELLFQYSVHTGEGLTLEAAKDRCKLHAPFFLSHCSKEEKSGSTEVAWSRTKFWRLLRKCGNVLDTLKERDRNVLKNIILPPTTKRPDSPAPAPPRQRSPSFERTLPKHHPQRIVPHIVDHDMLDIDSEVSSSGRSLSRKRKSPPVKWQAKGSLEGSLEEGRSFQPDPQLDNEAFNLLFVLFEDIWIGLEKQGKDKAKFKITSNTLRTAIYSRCSTKYEDPVVIVNYFSRRLVQQLPRKWEGTPFMEGLREVAKANGLTLGHIPYSKLLSKLQRRISKNHRTSQVATPTPSTNPLTHDIPSHHRKRDRHTLAEPSPEPPKPEVWEDRKPPRATAPPAQSWRHGRPKQEKVLPKPAGKTPRLSLVARKRRPSDEGRQPLDFSRISKAARISPQIDDEDEDEDDDSSLDSEDSRETRKVPTILRTEAMPSTVPKGPEGTWSCEEEGCGFAVRAADQPAGQDLVEQHIEGHMMDSGNTGLLNYAVAEGESRHLPVSHLLDRIRKIGDAAAERKAEAESEGRTFPERIKRHLGW